MCVYTSYQRFVHTKGRTAQARRNACTSVRMHVGMGACLHNTYRPCCPTLNTRRRAAETTGNYGSGFEAPVLADACELMPSTIRSQFLGFRIET